MKKVKIAYDLNTQIVSTTKKMTYKVCWLVKKEENEEKIAKKKQQKRERKSSKKETFFMFSFNTKESKLRNPKIQLKRKFEPRNQRVKQERFIQSYFERKKNKLKETSTEHRITQYTQRFKKDINMIIPLDAIAKTLVWS